MKFRTMVIHAGRVADTTNTPLNTPLYLSSTFSYPSTEAGKARFSGQEPGYFYSRMGNPTVTDLEVKLAALEGSDSAMAVSSGMAATSSTLYALTNHGDEVAFVAPLYGGTDAFLQQTLTRAGVTLTSYASDDDLLANIKPNTKVILFEPLTNPTLKVVDTRKVVAAAKKVGALTVCDNTFYTPYLFRPLALGVDVVVHSATKYLCGHGDVIAGVIAGGEALMQKIRTVAAKHIGSTISPSDAYLLLRGLKTLPLRMDAHIAGAAKVADYLSQQAGIKTVYFPGLSNHPGHAVVSDTVGHYGAMISFELEGGFVAVAKLLDQLKLFTQAVSLGDLESLICHPASTTHAIMSEADRLASGVTEGLVRVSIGVEDADDLIDDFKQAFAQALGA
ncbi:MAG: trans-sulfuration enzyme family protein [Neisseriaceae bacterium]